ncbi:DUF397 domain-containing protein [Streptomyces sp. NPDC048442]|uniref:DUF397 domain-containing protein n=1 Tax=Streptomyces sp. NPDC048442 TaxID=3154823 RepID=UPI003429068A
MRRPIDLSAAVWRKSSYSNQDGGECLEVAEFPEDFDWRKSSYSHQDGGRCLEVADDLSALVPVRDSKNPTGPALAFPSDSWASFVTAVKDDQLAC